MRGGTVRKSVPKCRNSSRRLSAGACHVRGFAPNTAILLRRDFVQPGAVRWNVERESAGDFAGVAFLPEIAQRAGFGQLQRGPIDVDIGRIGARSEEGEVFRTAIGGGGGPDDMVAGF